MFKLSAKLSAMSVEEKLGQMLFARTLASFPEDLVPLLERNLVGGIQLSRQASPSELTRLHRLQQQSPIPLLVGADLECGVTGGGLTGTRLGYQMQLGAVGEVDTAYAVGATVAREARAAGINFIFGPVADLVLSPENPLVNLRSYGSNLQSAAQLAVAQVRGLQDNGLLVAVKHFPGLGRGRVDSHIEPMILDCTLDDLQETELFVYSELIKKASLSGVMTGHVSLRNFDHEKPATLSKKIIDRLNQLGFSGLLITDSLAMKGIQVFGDHESITHQALTAGHDLILNDYNISPKKHFEYLLSAYEKGILSLAEIDRRVAKILFFKDKIFNQTPVPPDPVAAENLARKIAQEALIIDGDRAHLTQIDRADTLIVVAPDGHAAMSEKEVAFGDRTDTQLPQRLQKQFPLATVMTISDTPMPIVVEHILESARQFRQVVFVACALPYSYKGTADFSKPLLALLSGLHGRLTVMITVGNPLAAREMKKAPCMIYALDDSPAAECVIVDALAQKFTGSGKLPVQL